MFELNQFYKRECGAILYVIEINGRFAKGKIIHRTDGMFKSNPDGSYEMSDQFHYVKLSKEEVKKYKLELL